TVSTTLVVALVAATFYWRATATPKLTDKDTIVLTDFVNTTGDSVFDGALKRALTSQLAQSPFLNLLPDQRVRETLELMGRKADDPINKSVARAICQRNNLKAMLTGTIASLGSEYVVGLEAIDCRTGAVLAGDQTQVARKEAVLKALGSVTSNIRQ